MTAPPDPLKPGGPKFRSSISLNVFAFKSYSLNITCNQVSENSDPCFNGPKEQDFGLVGQ